MTPLAQVIQNQGLQTQTASQILTALTATINVLNSTRRDYAWAVVTFGRTIADGLYTAIASLSVPAATLYITAGIDLSLSESQEDLAAIATNVPTLAATCATLQTLGLNPTPQWQIWGLATAPTLDTITSALAEVVALIAWNTFLNETLNPLLSQNPFPSTSTIRSTIAAWSA